METKKTIIFIGNSGCGKGTQAEILEKRIKEKGEKVLHIELGDEFRNFLSMTTDTSRKALEISQTGQLQPEFLAIHLWSKILNLYYGKDKFLILDGTPRTLREAYILDGALKFYGVENPIVLYIETKRETAKERMLSRKRKDDTEEKIENRLNWFGRDTEKAIDFFINDSYYDFFKINGEGSIEEIEKEIEEKIKF
ncbi:hypothetical protein CSB11_01985 [Candidatus Campbellbacteria bacterium]|nr:MAG: hypothetical protein CSB11_01985 [Candidatus Campbellbacteria bacterium]